MIWRTTVLALATFIAFTPTASAEDEDPYAKGWQIYMAARETAGGGPGGKQLVDYTFDLVTELKTNDQTVQYNSTLALIVPYYQRQSTSSPIGKTVMIFDGKQAWQQTVRGKQHLPPSMVGTHRATMDRSHILLGPPPTRDAVHYLRDEEVAGRMTQVIQINDVGGTPLRLFVDTENADVLKHVFVGDVPGGGMAQVEEIFDGFVDVGGFRWHTEKTVLRNGKEAIRSVTSNLEVNVGLKVEDLLR